MPSLAFAAVGHTTHTPNLADNCTWDDVETVLDGPNADYVKVLEKPTHTKTGKILVTCKETFCDREEELTVQALDHDDEWVAKDLTLEEYAAGIVARGDVPELDNQYEANAWVKQQKAANICYVKNAYVCSCGRVEWRTAGLPDDEKSSLVPHDRGGVPACTDATCVKCGVVLKGAGHEHADQLADSEKIEANKIPATCGDKVSYKVKCDTCGKLLAVKADNDTTVTGLPHNYGTEVASSVATVLQSNGKYKVQSGYVGVKLDDTPAYATKTSEAIAAKDLANYKFYKYNFVVTEGDCTHAQTVGLKCTVCDTPTGATETLDPAHDWEKTHYEATCDHAGYNTYICKVCGVKGADAGKPDEVIATEPKLSHNYKVTKVPASCSNAQEYYVIECTTCDSKKCNHAYDGTTAGKVELKNTSTGTNIDNITPTGETKTKTLSWAGFDNELKGSSVMDFTFDLTVAPSHKYGAEEIVKAATCTTDAVYGKKCSECGKYDLANVYEKKGTKLRHTVVKNEVAATCGTAGYYTEKCSTCGFVKNKLGNMVDPSTIDGTTDAKTVKKTETDKALVKDGAKCSFDKWVVTKASTVFEEGVKTLTCSVCGAHDATKTVIAKKTVAKASNTVKAGKKSFNVKSSAANATGYRVYYKKAGAKSWKSYTKKTTSLSKTFSGLSKGKYYVKVRAYAKNYDGDGQVVWGATSSTKSVKVK